MKYKYVVIGSGSAGLVVALGLAKSKKKVLLIEKSQIGGDCTNFGCIPSKTLIHSAKISHNIQIANDFGIDITLNHFNTDNVFQKVRKTIEKIRQEDTQNLKQANVPTLKATASFVSPHVIEAREENGTTHKIKAKNIIIATGSSPLIPPIHGLHNTPYLTNETVFYLKKVPSSIAIIGGGAIGCELAQAFKRLGSDVFIIDNQNRLLSQEEEKASDVIKDVFIKEHINLYLDHLVDEISFENNEFKLHLKSKYTTEKKEIISKQLLIATGRKPNIEELNLEKADIEYTKKGIVVDKYARASQKNIFAIGDVIGPPYFTHLAEHHARSLLMTLLFPLPINIKIHPKFLPKVTFTDPEIASVGMSEKEAIDTFTEKKIHTYTLPIYKIDKAKTQDAEDGFIQIITKKYSSKILGAAIVSKRASEMLSEIYTAMNKKISLKSLIQIVHPYPTYNLGIRQIADKYVNEVLLKKKQ